MLRPPAEVSPLRRCLPWLTLSALSTIAIVVMRLPIELLAAPGVLVLASCFACAWRPQRAVQPSAADVTCDAEGVRRRGVLVARREELRQGVVVPANGHWIVKLEHKTMRPPLELVAWNAVEARGALRALGLNATQAVAERWGASRWMALEPWECAAVSGALLFLCWIAAFSKVVDPLLVLALGGAAFFVIPLVPTRIRVGADGVYTRWLGIGRFYAFSSIHEVRCYGGPDAPPTGGHGTGVLLTLVSGKSVRLPVHPRSVDDVAMLIERIEEALEEAARGERTPELSVLMRGERDDKRWILALRAIGSGANVGMRTSPLPPDRLLQIVEDTRAQPLARVTAAIAIAQVIPPSERRRIRIAAEASAAPGLRRALERAAGDADDDELAELLASIEASEDRPHTPR